MQNLTLNLKLMLCEMNNFCMLDPVLIPFQNYNFKPENFDV